MIFSRSAVFRRFTMVFAVALLAFAACGGNSAGGEPFADAGPTTDSPANTTPGTDAGADARSEAVLDAPAQAPDAAADGGTSGASRSFYMASTGAQMRITGPALGLQLTEANLADDVDMFAVHQEFYGLPWDAFENDTPPLSEWATVMDRLATGATTAGKPVFLSVTMLDGNRSHLAPQPVVEDGQLKTVPDGSADCYDFATAADAAARRAAYLRYVTYMVNKFKPAYLNVAVEVNLFFEKCAGTTGAVGGLVSMINDAYDAAKAAKPDVVVFPSFQIDHLYGYSTDSCPDVTEREACFDAAYAQIAGIKRDRFGISSYPMLSGVAGGGLPADWFARGAARGGERAVITETGWDSTPLVAQMANGTCYTVFTYAESDAASYLRNVLDQAEAAHMDLVTWWSNRDLVVSPFMTDCPCTFDDTWCTVLQAFRQAAGNATPDAVFYGEVLAKAFGTMGVRLYDGTPKPQVFSIWDAARKKTRTFAN